MNTTNTLAPTVPASPATPAPAPAPRTLREIALEILREWGNPSPHAMPYLRAMTQLRTMQDKYILDDAESVVLYFLSNSTSWRGDAARRIKTELKAMLPKRL